MTTPITPLPTPPTRSDPVNFAARADALMTALPTFVTQVNTVGNEIETLANAADVDAAAANASKLAAQQSEIAAAASVAAAAAAAGAVQWVSGTNYNLGVVVWSPITFFNYRRRVSGVSTVDPSNDAAGWALIGAPLAMPQQYVTSNTNAQAGVHYILLNAVTLTFPASPLERDVIMITDVSNTANCFINPNGKKIRNDATVMKLNTRFMQKAFYYTTDAGQGWI